MSVKIRMAVAAGVAVVAAGAFLAQRNLDERQRANAIAAAKTFDEFQVRIATVQAWARESIGLELIPIRGGTFQMGSARGHSEERPVTQVTLRDFALGKTEVTQRQWEAVMPGNPSRFRGDELPVENVSWNEAMAFCRKLTELARAAGKLPVDLEFTLPTEAQWEYACRAGTSGDYSGDLEAMAWYDINSGLKTHPVGIKQANAWRLHDMHGNVWEWCRDWFQEGLPGGRVVEPGGPSSGAFRVYRGGGWSGDAGNSRSSIRFRIAPEDIYDGLGLRLALTSVR